MACSGGLSRKRRLAPVNICGPHLEDIRAWGYDSRMSGHRFASFFFVACLCVACKGDDGSVYGSGMSAETDPSDSGDEAITTGPILDLGNASE